MPHKDREAYNQYHREWMRAKLASDPAYKERQRVRNLWANNPKRKEYNDRAHKKLRQQALDAYGGARCACCGETIWEFLCIDHIAGGGNKQRFAIGNNGKFYNWLRQNSYPPGYQVLCHNCNLAKGFYGACPHTKAQT